MSILPRFQDIDTYLPGN